MTVLSTQEAGGIMTLADVYCRFNRARGMEVRTGHRMVVSARFTKRALSGCLSCLVILQLVSPDDVVNACMLFQPLGLPLRCDQLNPLPTNDAHVASWTLHKPIGIYMRDSMLGVYTSVHGFCFF